MNSPYNCAARVLLCAITKVGLLSCWITFAMVNVFPDPVTPSKVWHWLPSLKPFTSFSIACGWSPVGLKALCNLKILCASCTKTTSRIYSKKVRLLGRNSSGHIFIFFKNKISTNHVHSVQFSGSGENRKTGWITCPKSNSDYSILP